MKRLKNEKQCDQVKLSHLKQYLCHCNYVTNPLAECVHRDFCQCCGSLSLGRRSTDCSLISTISDESHHEKRCLNNLCGWTPPPVCVGLGECRRPCTGFSDSLDQWLPMKHCCHSALRARLIGVIDMWWRRKMGHAPWGKTCHGAYLTQPASSASTWNSRACYHGNRETGSGGSRCCFSASLADAFGGAHSLNDGSPTRPLNTSHNVPLPRWLKR